MNYYDRSGLGTTYQKMLLPDPAEKEVDYLLVTLLAQDRTCVRIPRTHNKEAFIFHSSNLLSWVNHIADPSC
jgi:hypothetical protein